MSLEAALVKEEPDTMADEVFIKQEELETDCVEVPYVAIEAAIVDVEFDPPVPPEELYSKDLSEPAVYLSKQDELLKPECMDMSSCLEADSVSQYADVKDELTLEPDCIQRPNTAITSLPREKFNPVLTDCWVRLERCAAAEKALKKQLAELYQLYVKENRTQTRMGGDEDFLCEKCKKNEKYEFCEACITKMRALNQLRNINLNFNGKKYKTCEICCEKFAEIKHLYQHKFLIHGNFKILQKMNNPTEFYSGYLSRVYSEKTICGSTSNLPNATNVNTEKLLRIEYDKTEARKVMHPKIVTDVLNLGNMVPKSKIKRERTVKPYKCKVCKKPAMNEKFCDECLKERLIGNMYVKMAKVENKFVDQETVLRIKRPHLHKEKNQTSLRKQQNLRKTKTRECSVRLERNEVAEQALQIKIEGVKSEIVENTIMWPSQSTSNMTSETSEERCCNICKTETPVGAKFCEACEKEQAEKSLIRLKMGFCCSMCKMKTVKTPVASELCEACEKEHAENILIALKMGYYDKK
ncbi:uncharacterized protein LOC134752231 [Cydia strobilella]|uniref:uncharacterized protein LOC134752231 n=1 Tax=Cydia strobilella TaxID=1100964 RepID=UPI003004C050